MTPRLLLALGFLSFGACSSRPPDAPPVEKVPVAAPPPPAPSIPPTAEKAEAPVVARGPSDLPERSLQEELKLLGEQRVNNLPRARTRVEGFELELLGWVPRGEHFRVAYVRLENGRAVATEVLLEQAELVGPKGAVVPARRVLHSPDEERQGLVRAGTSIVVGAVFEWTAVAEQAHGLRLSVGKVPVTLPLKAKQTRDGR